MSNNTNFKHITSKSYLTTTERQENVPNKITKGNVIHVASRINETFSVAKSPKRSFLGNLNLYVTQYCDKTTIQGIKYIRECDRYILEKLIWALIILFFGATCVTSAYYTYLKWKSSPIMISFAASETSISRIPFPAITICPEVQFNKDIFNFTGMLVKKRNGANFTIEEEEHLQYASLICDNEEMFQISGWNETHDIRKNLFQMHCPPLGQYSRITWFGKQTNITQALVPTFTSEGVCYTFNMLHNKEIVKFEDNFTASLQHAPISNKWTYEEGYLSSNKSDVYPYTAFVTGLEDGLVVEALLTNISFTDYLCKGFLQGFKVTLHHPYELPNMDKHFRLPLDQTVFSVVKASLINVSPALLNYRPKDRQCYFAKEKHLASYRMYTQQNCLHECLANFTYRRCGCIPFYFPLPHGNIKHCPPASNKCVKQSKLTYMEENADSENQPCECLPCCTSLSYNTHISQTDWNPRHLAKILGKNPNITHLKKFHFSKLHVYYKDLQFLSCERNEGYGTMEFFSHIGGLLGLFLGFSVISAIEILYFCTLRILCNIKKYGFAGWFGEPTPCAK